MTRKFDQLLQWLQYPKSGVRYLYPIGLMALLFVQSSIPDTREPAHVGAKILQWVSPNVQNLLHIPAYCLLGILWCRAIKPSFASVVPLSAISFILSAGYGVFDEWHQSFVPGRFSTATDLALNICGSALGAFLFSWAIRSSDKESDGGTKSHNA